VKIRMTLIGGERRMLVWDDLQADEKVKVYDKGIDTSRASDLRVNYRAGDMWAPRIEPVEALQLETQYFADCITNGKPAVNDGYAGLRVVRMLEAIDASISQKGRMVYCRPAMSASASRE